MTREPEILSIDYDLNFFPEILPCSKIDNNSPLNTIIKGLPHRSEAVSCLYINKSRESKIGDVIRYNRGKKQKSILIFGLGNVGGTILIALRMLLDSENINFISIYDKNPHLMERYEIEVNQIHPPYHAAKVPVKILKDLDDIPSHDIILFCAAAGIPPLGISPSNVRDIQYLPNRKILDSIIDILKRADYMGSIVIVSDPVDILCTYLKSRLNLLSAQVTGMGLGVMASRANYLLLKEGYRDFYRKGIIFGPHNEGVIAIPDRDNSTLNEVKTLSQNIESLNFSVRERGFYPYIAPAVSSAAYNLAGALQGREVLSCIYIDSIYWGFRTKYYNGLWFPVIQGINRRFIGYIKTRFRKFKERTQSVMKQ